MTVPPRYLELGDLRRESNISGKFGEAALAARDAYLARYYPEIDGNNWREQSEKAGRRRPHVEAFATHPLTDGSQLIPRSALLDALEDDDDIE